MFSLLYSFSWFNDSFQEQIDFGHKDIVAAVPQGATGVRN